MYPACRTQSEAFSIPTCDVVPRDVAGCMDELREFQPAFHDGFARSEPREHLFDSMVGQCSTPERKSIEPMALEVEVEPKQRDNHVLRIAQGHDVAPSLGHLAPTEMALERTRSGHLRSFEIESEIVRRLDPGNHSRDVVESHVATSPETVNDLLQPGGAGLGVRRQDDVGRSRRERQAASYAVGGHDPTLHLAVEVPIGGPSRRRALRSDQLSKLASASDSLR